MVKKNDVIQINEAVPEWTGCLLMVDEVKSWGVLAHLRIPFKGDAYIRLTNDQYELIGESVFEVVEDEEK